MVTPNFTTQFRDERHGVSAAKLFGVNKDTRLSIRT